VFCNGINTFTPGGPGAYAINVFVTNLSATKTFNTGNLIYHFNSTALETNFGLAAINIPPGGGPTNIGGLFGASPNPNLTAGLGMYNLPITQAVTNINSNVNGGTTNMNVVYCDNSA
jgi:hypothetical protein